MKKEAGVKEQKLQLDTEAEIIGMEKAFNDKVVRPVQVVDRKVRILYIENAPRWEYKYLQQGYLLRDRRVEPKFILVNADAEAIRPPEGVKPKDWPYLTEFPATTLGTFDLIILGDVSTDWLNDEKLTMIQDFVRNGGGLIHIAGQHNAPACFVNRPSREKPFAEVLPVEFEAARFKQDESAQPQPYIPELTEDGQRSEMLTLGNTPEDTARIWKKITTEGHGFYWHYPVKGLRTGATSLLAHPRDKMGEPGKQKPMTLMATQTYGDGPVLFLATDETWRWRSNGNDRYVAQLWGQIVYEMGMKHLLRGSKQVHISLQGGPEAVLNSNSYLFVTAYDKNAQAL